MQDLRRYIHDKLRSRNTYIVAMIVDTCINGYGHFLVLTLRGEEIRHATH
ncbi:MAG: hypothetical protein VYC64_01305 [Candidatus Latescibacterota bacterium]|nr:hypothetical protein [Candidatus Latescibacterota bacterium]MEC8990100.1 hypothetical protein [Candidatus Latescibacterota bacterium]MED5413560.1 hypothetical protein [Candidatus Latescibacterota bacterium]MEE3043259.1 hypothetical protein [Candidatus Latescibacterota bacterium]MEE3337895.1 hypothetical protein [Candidatus Latescibacterota bacterium]